jgi:hypothetical protein
MTAPQLIEKLREKQYILEIVYPNTIVGKPSVEYMGNLQLPTLTSGFPFVICAMLLSMLLVQDCDSLCVPRCVVGAGL